jgi:predicted MPP superfamily phosphohydrolase
MKKFLPAVLAILMSGFCLAQYEVQTVEYFGNNYQGKRASSKLYFVFGFTDYYDQYFFDNSGNAILIKLTPDGKKEESTINKSDFYSNKKNGLLEYYVELNTVYKIDEIEDFELILSSTDYQNFCRYSFGSKERKALTKSYGPPPKGSGSKAMLKYYQKTGISSGQLVGANTNFTISKSKKCSAKKREMRKDGINGVKEMTYGM